MHAWFTAVYAHGKFSLGANWGTVDIPGQGQSTGPDSRPTVPKFGPGIIFILYRSQVSYISTSTKLVLKLLNLVLGTILPYICIIPGPRPSDRVRMLHLRFCPNHGPGY